MDDVIVQKLLQTNKPAEKAAVIAKYFFSELPTEAAKVARQCTIFHWFNHSIIEALLQETQLSSAEKEKFEQQITGLPFVERLPWGYRYQVLTREGLLSQDSLAQPELLQEAARFAASVYTSRKENRMDIVESFFCHIVAGNRSESIRLLDDLMGQAIEHENWAYAGDLIRLQDEAEQLPFVLPLPRSEKHWIQRGTVHSVQGKLEDALADFEQAIRMNSRSIPAYIGRGKVFAKQQKYKRALVDYNYALKFEPTNIYIYTGRSAVYAKQGQYEDALRDLDRSLEIEPDNPNVMYNKGTVLSNLEQVEQALAVYNVILQLYPTMVEAHIGKGEALFELQRYPESLAAYEEAIRLDRYLADAQRGKGNALIALNRYAEAELAYEEARQLDFYTTGMDNGALEQTPADQEIIQDDSRINGEPTGRNAVVNHGRITSPDKPSRKDRSRKRPGKRTINRLGFYLGRIISLGAVVAVIIGSVLLFRSFHISTKPSINATAIANARKTAIAHANQTATAIAATATAAASTYPFSAHLLLSDPLSDNSKGSGWQTDSLCKFQGNAYHATDNQTNTFTACSAVNTNFSNFTFEVEALLNSGDGIGITFRGNADKSQFYRFAFFTDGSYALYVYVDNTGTNSRKLTNGNITPTPDLTNTNLISVVARGSTMTIYLNKTEVTTFTDPTYTSGQIGVAVTDISKAADGVFANVNVWALP